MTKFKTSWHQSHLADFLNPASSPTPQKADHRSLDVLLLQNLCWVSAVNVVLGRLLAWRVQGPVFLPQSPNKQACYLIQSIYAVFENRMSNMVGEEMGFSRRWALSLWFFFKFFASIIFSPGITQNNTSFFHIIFFLQGLKAEGRWSDIPFLSYPSQFVKISTRHHGLDGVGRRGWASKQLGSWGLHNHQGGEKERECEGGANLKDLERVIRD